MFIIVQGSPNRKVIICEYDNDIISGISQLGDKFLKSIGILTNINFDIAEIGETQLGRWGKCKLATVAFGHGTNTRLRLISDLFALGRITNF